MRTPGLFSPQKAGEAHPRGAVRTGVLEDLLTSILGREVARQEILHLKVRRKSARAGPGRRPPEITIRPSGGRGARGTGLWSFGDLVRIAAILGLSPGTPRLRAAVWSGLTDEYLAAVIRELRVSLADLQSDSLRLARVTRISASRRRSLPEELLFLLPADLRRYLFVPWQSDEPPGGTRALAGGAASLTGAWIDVTSIALRAFLEWEATLATPVSPS